MFWNKSNATAVDPVCKARESHVLEHSSAKRKQRLLPLRKVPPVDAMKVLHQPDMFACEFDACELDAMNTVPAGLVAAY